MFLLSLSFLLIISSVSCLEPPDIVFVIVSQHEGYHRAHAQLLKDTIIEESLSHDKETPEVVLTYEEHVNGSWTFIPLIPLLSTKFPQAEWIVFCLDNTAIRVHALIDTLSTFVASKDYFIGHALADLEPTIIHHFADQRKKLKYPNAVSAFAISKSLLSSLNKRIEVEGLPNIDFNIDASYELASWIYDEGKGTRLTHVPQFCVYYTANCVSYPKGFHACASTVTGDNIYVAVKTYEKYHNDRIPIIQKTWLKYVKNVNLFSNVKDKDLKNIIVVPNTSEGHCAKTHAILVHANKVLKDRKIDWLIVVDDDTILSMERLTRLLTCYNPANPTAIGERYGYRVMQGTGYEYLTGGAGLALSAPLVERMVESSYCKCPTASTPDDMFLFGICLNRVGIRPTHSSLFHQARPSDYSEAYLASQEPISFHKFWMVDPVQVYQYWFADADMKLMSKHVHSEL